MKTLIFDFDGTIADTFDVGLEIVNVLANRWGKPSLNHLSVEEIRDMDAKTWFKKLGIPFWQIIYSVKLVKQEFKKRLSEIALFPGILHTISTLKNRYRIGIITSNSLENVNHVLDKYHLNFSSFDFINSASSIFGKTRELKSVMKVHGLKKSDMIYVGDEVRDILAAKKFGVKIVAVTWGYNSKNLLKKFKPNYLIDNHEELVNIHF